MKCIYSKENVFIIEGGIFHTKDFEIYEVIKTYL